MAEKAKEVYGKFPDAESWYGVGSLEHAKFMEKRVFGKWNDCFSEFVAKQSNSNTAKICTETTVKLQDYNKSLGRRLLCIDDIRSVLTNKHKFRVIYSDKDTYLTKDPSFEPQEEETGLALFEGL